MNRHMEKEHAGKTRRKKPAATSRIAKTLLTHGPPGGTRGRQVRTTMAHLFAAWGERDEGGKEGMLLTHLIRGDLLVTAGDLERDAPSEDKTGPSWGFHGKAVVWVFKII